MAEKQKQSFICIIYHVLFQAKLSKQKLYLLPICVIITYMIYTPPPMFKQHHKSQKTMFFLKNKSKLNKTKYIRGLFLVQHFCLVYSFLNLSFTYNYYSDKKSENNI